MTIAKRWLLVLACLALAVLRLRWPEAKVDAITVWLVGIAAALLLLPELKAVLPYVKRVRVGDAEVELEQLQKEVEEASDAVAARPASVPADVGPSVDEVIREAGRDPRAALLLLSSKLEQQVRLRLEEAGAPRPHAYATLPRLMEKGVEAGIFPATLRDAVQDFWTARNAVAHGRAFDVPDATLYALLSLGTQLLRTVSARRDG